MRRLRVGTRRSQLATTQTGAVVAALKKERSDLEIETVEIVTRGDQILDVSLSKVGGKGLFVSEIEKALQDGVIDIAVHSAKDVPAILAQGLVIGAIPPREDPRDLLIAKNGQTLRDLPEGARVGTSSLRRRAQLLAIRPDLEVVPLRGNIDTRLRKLQDLDAIVLAAAGIHRMGWLSGQRVQAEGVSYDVTPLTPFECVPAAGQGALAIECREQDTEVLQLLAAIHDRETERCVMAERAFLAEVGGSCQVPVGAYAAPSFSRLNLAAMLADARGNVVLRGAMMGENARELGRELALRMLAGGGDRLLAMTYEV
ncbi:hydroxymethylbilane synthase [Ferroacidibacillus organovorans]|uniref:Porphobilinogen deaminase n=1 Tax=Ferroacidibacillus organovorans TaxID=1765683 RepID=A0A117SYC0_9BACL|nr:hydroxymethylbilane synthase [Ferroacidibacillus organovorans]KUO96708.1 porphobilinogen deaminase [Ferroacidibacillus organovorans]